MTTAPSTAALLCLASVAAAQLPDGHYVVSTLSSTGITPGGLFFVDPRVPGPPTAVSGLGPDLTGLGMSPGGANCVSYRRNDASLIVGELAPGGTQVDLHVIQVSGSSVVRDVAFNVGIADPSRSGGISQMAILPNQDVLVGVADLQPLPPLLGSPLGVVSTALNTVTPIVLTPVPIGICNAATVDPTGSNVYFAMVQFTLLASDLYSVPISGGTPRRITTLQDVVGGLAVDRFGRLITMQAGRSVPTISSIDPATGGTTLVANVGANPNGLGLERVTDHIVYVLNGFGPQGPGVFYLNRSGVSTMLTNAFASVPSGIDVNHDPWTYGRPTPGTSRYEWLVEPNPGGLPRLGSATFSLSVRATPAGAAAGVLIGSLSPGAVNVAGIEVLVHAAQIFVTAGIPASGDFPLPLPVTPSLAGLVTFFQSVHADGGGPLGVATSQGLRLGLLR